MVRDIGDMTIREKVENQIRLLDGIISKLAANLPGTLEGLRDAAGDALGFLKGSRALFAEVIPNLKELEELVSQAKKQTPRPRTQE